MADAAQRKLHFSIVMPAYNEEAVVEKTLTTLADHLDRDGFSYEIIVIDDASRDSTGAVVARVASARPQIACIRNEGPNGYGYAIRRGLDVYQGDAVVIVTADGSDAPKDVAAFFRKIEEGFDCAFGSRFVEGAKVVGYPPLKLFMNRAANAFIALVIGARYDDFTNGFKCYRRGVIDAMQPLVAGQFNITIELCVKAILGGFRFSVTPTDWSEREAGQSSFNVFKLMRPYAATLIYCVTADYLKKVRR